MKKNIIKVLKISVLLMTLVIIFTASSVFVISYKFVNLVRDRKHVIALPILQNEIALHREITTPKSNKYKKSTEELKANKNETIFFDLAKKLDSFTMLEEIDQDMKRGAFPSICEILCNQSTFNFTDSKTAGKVEPLTYLNDFYSRKGASAFEDPKFRIAMDTARTIAGLFSPSMREMVWELGQLESRSGESTVAEKISFSARMPAMLLKEMAIFNYNRSDRAEQNRKTRQIAKLYKTCTQEDLSEIKRKCLKIIN